MIIISTILFSGITYAMDNRNPVPLQLIVHEMMIAAAINNIDLPSKKEKVVYTPINEKPVNRNNVSPKKKYIIHQPNTRR